MQDCGESHGQESRYQGGFASDAVAKMAEDCGTDGSREEGQRKGRE